MTANLPLVSLPFDIMTVNDGSAGLRATRMCQFSLHIGAGAIFARSHPFENLHNFKIGSNLARISLLLNLT